MSFGRLWFWQLMRSEMFLWKAMCLCCVDRMCQKPSSFCRFSSVLERPRHWLNLLPVDHGWGFTYPKKRVLLLFCCQVTVIGCAVIAIVTVTECYVFIYCIFYLFIYSVICLSIWLMLQQQLLVTGRSHLYILQCCTLHHNVPYMYIQPASLVVAIF